MQAILTELLRQARVETTMKFYVGENADAPAEVIWDVADNTLGNSGDSAAGRN